jgi:hypothetical protein
MHMHNIILCIQYSVPCYIAIWQAKVHLINPRISMQSIVLAKCHTMVIVGSCRTVDAIVGNCRTVDVNYPDSQVRFNSNKKSTDETLFKLYQTDRQQSI